ncbi:MAG: hypothetical protein OIN89_08485 [Candidatus Methanoperedens sp.]|jgi:hypothetical protein|nr:hypothetical protein [Candidatus Methanoperedens sp.]PKL53368.1 MAG: hypothetical protein CVV36_07505 [Candidatus Methanoperedenaceae archaeon HGW-Methanoperedenaceae-1]
MKNTIKYFKYLTILIILLIGSNLSGCIDSSDQYSPIKYTITIETNDWATIYLPVLLDLPNNTVADLVSYLKVDKKKSSDIKVIYDIIDTNHGKALRINTSGNVTLKAVAGNEYYKNHLELPITPFIPGKEEQPKFFNMSMKVNKSNIHWAYLETNADNQVKVQILSGANIKYGGEYLDSISDGSDDRLHFFTMEHGWQTIGFRRSVVYY